MTRRSVEVALIVFVVNIPLAWFCFFIGQPTLAIIVILLGTAIIYGIAFGALEF